MYSKKHIVALLKAEQKRQESLKTAYERKLVVVDQKVEEKTAIRQKNAIDKLEELRKLAKKGPLSSDVVNEFSGYGRASDYPVQLFSTKSLKTYRDHLVNQIVWDEEHAMARETFDQVRAAINIIEPLTLGDNDVLSRSLLNDIGVSFKFIALIASIHGNAVD